MSLHLEWLTSKCRVIAPVVNNSRRVNPGETCFGTTMWTPMTSRAPTRVSRLSLTVPCLPISPACITLVSMKVCPFTMSQPVYARAPSVGDLNSPQKRVPSHTAAKIPTWINTQNAVYQGQYFVTEASPCVRLGCIDGLDRVQGASRAPRPAWHVHPCSRSTVA